WYILGKHSSAFFIKNSNTEDSINENCLLESNDKFKEKDTPLTAQIFQTSEILEESTVTETETIENECLKLLNSFELETTVEELYTAKDPCEEDNLMNISGSVAKKFKNKYPFLEDNNNETNIESRSWMSYISKGYLTCPSKDLWNVSKVLETIFMQEFDNERGIVKKLTTIVNQHVNEKCIMISNEVIECLVRTRMYIRIRE
ncbi:hypothetical protein AGLY_017968, partial [Aphis glycines]